MKPIDGLRLFLLLGVECLLIYFLSTDYNNNPKIYALYEQTGLHVTLLVPIVFLFAIALCYGFREAGKIIIALGCLVPGVTVITMIMAGPGSIHGLMLILGGMLGGVIAGVGLLFLGIGEAYSRLRNKSQTSNNESSILYYVGIAVVIVAMYFSLTNLVA